jgi:hypothetical protein
MSRGLEADLWTILQFTKDFTGYAQSFPMLSAIPQSGQAMKTFRAGTASLIALACCLFSSSEIARAQGDTRINRVSAGLVKPQDFSLPSGQTSQSSPLLPYAPANVAPSASENDSPVLPASANVSPNAAVNDSPVSPYASAKVSPNAAVNESRQSVPSNAATQTDAQRVNQSALPYVPENVQPDAQMHGALSGRASTSITSVQTSTGVMSGATVENTVLPANKKLKSENDFQMRNHGLLGKVRTAAMFAQNPIGTLAMPMINVHSPAHSHNALALPPGIHLTADNAFCPLHAMMGPMPYGVGGNPWAEISSIGPMRSRWDTWLNNVQAMLKSHEPELMSTPGLTALHVIIWPDGTIGDVRIFNGSERQYGGTPVSPNTTDRTYSILRRIAKLPPFPPGSRLSVRHLLIYAISNP